MLNEMEIEIRKKRATERALNYLDDRREKLSRRKNPNNNYILNINKSLEESVLDFLQMVNELY